MRTISFLALFIGTAWAQLPLKSSLLDKPALEQYLRHMEAWIPAISVTIDDPKPSVYLRGFNDVTVHLSYNGQGKDEHYYVSNDGKNIVKGDVYDTAKSPFAFPDETILSQTKFGTNITNDSQLEEYNSIFLPISQG